MSSQLYNNVSTTLASSINESSVSISVASTEFPAVEDGDYIPIYVVSTNGSYETMHVTSVDGSNLTVTRGAEGTEPLQFYTGDKVQVRLTRQSLSDVDATGMSVNNSTVGESVIRRFSSYEEMRGVDAAPGSTAHLDDGDRSGFFVSASGLTDDSGTVIGGWSRIREDESLAMVEWYGDTSADVQRALDNNTTIRFKSGKTYTASAVVYSAMKSARIECNGCRFVIPLTNSDGVFHLFGGWGDVVGISAQGVDGNYSYVDIDTPINVSRGDVVKLSTGQPYEYFLNQGTAGEFREIYGTENNGTRIIFTSPLRFSYNSSTASISKLDMSPIEVVGPVDITQTLGAPNQTEYPTGQLIRIGSAYKPVVRDVNFPFVYGSCVSTWSCFNASIINASCQFAANMSDGRDYEGMGYVGYGIRDCNSFGTYVENLNASNARHGYVAIGSGGGDSGPGVVRGLSDVGPCMGSRVVNSAAFGCTNSGFDTHHGQEWTTFEHCVSRNGQGSGFQARGVGTTFIDCVSQDDAQGLMAFIQSAYESNGQAVTDNTTWKGGAIINPRDLGFRLNVNTGNTIVSDLDFIVNRSLDNFSEIFYNSDGSTLHVNDLDITVTAPVPAMRYIFSGSSGSDIYVKNCTGTFVSSAQLSGDAVFKGFSGSICYVDNLRLWRGNFDHLFSGTPDSGGIITNVMVELSSTVIDGVSDSNIENYPNMVGPICDGRNFNYGAHNFNGDTVSTGGSDPYYKRYKDGTQVVWGSYESAVSVGFPVNFMGNPQSVSGTPYNENSGDQTVVVTKIANNYTRLDTKTSSGSTSSTGGFFVAYGRWK